MVVCFCCSFALYQMANDRIKNVRPSTKASIDFFQCPIPQTQSDKLTIFLMSLAKHFFSLPSWMKVLISWYHLVFFDYKSKNKLCLTWDMLERNRIAPKITGSFTTIFQHEQDSGQPWQCEEAEMNRLPLQLSTQGKPGPTIFHSCVSLHKMQIQKTESLIGVIWVTCPLTRGSGR